MAKKLPHKDETEAFVRRVLKDTFKQKVDKETLREVVAKVSEAIATKTLKGNRSTEAA